MYNLYTVEPPVSDHPKCTLILMMSIIKFPRNHKNKAPQKIINNNKFLNNIGQKYKTSTPLGFEPGIPRFVVRCLIRWATGPSVMDGSLFNPK